MKNNKLIGAWKLGSGVLFACLFTLSMSQYCTAQEAPFVDNISYQYTESHRLAFPIGVTFDDIHAYDMPSLEYKEMSYLIEKSIDSDNNPQTVQTFAGAINFYEDWQRLAERWLFNQDGTTMYGVEGKGRSKTYYEKETIEHSRKGLEIYSSIKEQVNLSGYLSSLIFPQNITKILDGNSQENEVGISYNIAPDGSVVVTNGSGEYIIYQEIDNDNDSDDDNGNGNVGVITEIKYQEDPDNPVYPVFPDGNDPDVITMTISVFDIDLCGLLFLSSSTEVVKEVLFNGLCAKRITENTYRDYNFECQQTALRSSSKNESIGEMTLSPNPLRSDLLSIALPISLDNEVVQIKIIALNGQYVGEVTQPVNGNVMQVNIGDMISTQGLYIISLQSPTYSNKKRIFYTIN